MLTSYQFHHLYPLAFLSSLQLSFLLSFVPRRGVALTWWRSLEHGRSRHILMAACHCRIQSPSASWTKCSPSWTKRSPFILGRGTVPVKLLIPVRLSPRAAGLMPPLVFAVRGAPCIPCGPSFGSCCHRGAGVDPFSGQHTPLVGVLE